MHNVALGIIIGLFLGGIFQARPKFEWNLGVKQPVIPQWNINPQIRNRPHKMTQRSKR